VWREKGKGKREKGKGKISHPVAAALYIILVEET
jgi:hypothetical protein